MAGKVCLVLGTLITGYFTYYGIYEVRTGTFDGTSIIMDTFFAVIAAGLFYLAYRWWNETPIADFFGGIVDRITDFTSEYSLMTGKQRVFFWLMRLVAIILIGISFVIFGKQVMAFDISEGIIIVGTIILVAGVSLWKVALPSEYEEIIDDVKDQFDWDEDPTDKE